MQHTRTLPVLRLAAVAMALGLSLVACGQDEPSESGSPAPSTGSAEQQPSQTPTLTEQPTPQASSAQASASPGSSAAARKAAEVEIGKEFTDPETGDVVTVVSAVRNNPTEYYEATDNPDGEMVYLRVKVVPGKDFGGTISSADFYLDSDGKEKNYASSASGELEAAGYDYFDYASRRDGEHTGYIPIYVPKTGDTLEGAYLRPEAKVLGGDEKIPEFRAQFVVPAS